MNASFKPDGDAVALYQVVDRPVLDTSYLAVRLAETPTCHDRSPYRTLFASPALFGRTASEGESSSADTAPGKMLSGLKAARNISYIRAVFVCALRYPPSEGDKVEYFLTLMYIRIRIYITL